MYIIDDDGTIFIACSLDSPLTILFFYICGNHWQSGTEARAFPLAESIQPASHGEDEASSISKEMRSDDNTTLSSSSLMNDDHGAVHPSGVEWKCIFHR